MALPVTPLLPLNSASPRFVTARLLISGDSAYCSWPLSTACKASDALAALVTGAALATATMALKQIGKLVQRAFHLFWHGHASVRQFYSRKTGYKAV